MKVMVFWLAKYDVMAKLFDECLASKDEIHCLIQKGDHMLHAHLYPEVHFTVVGSDWSQYKASGTDLHLHDDVVDVVYIPSSTPYFYGFDKIFPIVRGLRYQCVTLCDYDGNKRAFQRGNALQAYVRYRLTCIGSALFRVAYQFKCLVSGR